MVLPWEPTQNSNWIGRSWNKKRHTRLFSKTNLRIYRETAMKIFEFNCKALMDIVGKNLKYSIFKTPTIILFIFSPNHIQVFFFNYCLNTIHIVYIVIKLVIWALNCIGRCWNFFLKDFSCTVALSRWQDKRVRNKHMFMEFRDLTLLLLWRFVFFFFSHSYEFDLMNFVSLFEDGHFYSFWVISTEV